MLKSIIVHGGNAHRDDFLAVCVALNIEETNSRTNFLRKDPSAEELADPSVLVLDVGREHEPTRNNFDHHQFDRNAPADCALSLYLMSRDINFSALGWFKITKILDSKGPNAVATELGLERFPFSLMSPIEATILSMFEGCEDDFATMTPIMMDIGFNILEYAKELNWVTGKVETLPVITLNEVAFIVCEDAELTQVNAFGNALGKRVDASREKGIVIGGSISPNIDRNTNEPDGGWVLYRFDDDARLDYSVLEGNADIAFAHKGGFLAVTTKIGLEKAKELATLAIK